MPAPRALIVPEYHFANEVDTATSDDALIHHAAGTVGEFHAVMEEVLVAQVQRQGHKTCNVELRVCAGDDAVGVDDRIGAVLIMSRMLQDCAKFAVTWITVGLIGLANTTLLKQAATAMNESLRIGNRGIFACSDSINAKRDAS